MDYKNFDLIDFVLDDFFQQWIIHRDKESCEFWEVWICENQDKEKIIKQARAIIQNIDFEPADISKINKTKVLDNINAIIKTEELTDELQMAREPQDHSDDEVNETIIYSFRSRKDRIRFWYRIAAVFVFTLVAGGAGYLYHYFSTPLIIPEIANEYIEKSTNSGEQSKIKLSDGTRIKLNSNSKLIFPRRFSEHERKITLVGEAFFEVAKDTTRPFKVTSGDILTMVHGTSFNIRAFPHEKEIKVAVATGKVSVIQAHLTREEKLHEEVLFLNPPEMAVFEKDIKKTIKMDFEYLEVLGWKDGILHFSNADIHEVFNTLETWYGVTFIKNRKVNQLKDYTGSFDNKSLEIVLEGLSYVFEFQYEIKGKIIEIN